MEQGGLYSWGDCEQKGINIAKPGGSDTSRSLDKRDNLQHYVRLSFCKQHPMQFVAMNDGRISNPVVLEIDLEVAYWEGCRYADRNAVKNGTHVGESLAIWPPRRPATTLTCPKRSSSTIRPRCSCRTMCPCATSPTWPTLD